MLEVEKIISIDNNYIANGIGEFRVATKSNDEVVVFKEYSTYTFSWEKSFIKSPTRANNGAMGDLDTYSTFITPHLKVTYDTMPIDLYRQMIKLINAHNEFVVSCYDPIYDTITVNKMYFATQETPNFYTEIVKDDNGENAVKLIGVHNYTVELIGTNNEV